jgi:N-acyl homoserine lactone hydrolase
MRLTLAVFAAAAALAACGQSVTAPPAPDVRLYAIDCGRIALTDAGAFADDDSFNGVQRTLVDGDLIWDAGFPDAIADMPDGMPIEALNAVVTVPTKFVDQLAELEMTPADIEFVAFSHGHGDHVGNAALFTNATWIVDAEERAHMFRPEARSGQEFQMYAALEGRTPRLIEGDADYDVFNDGSVTIIQTPGHTPGHTVLLVRLPNTGAVLLSGDMYHLAEARERRTVPRFNFDRDQTLASMDKVERIAAETEALVIRQHVQEDFDALPRFPEALN